VCADDSVLIRETLADAFFDPDRVRVLASCRDRLELEAAVEACHPDVVVTDIRMPPSGGDEGIGVAAWLRQTRPEIGVLVLSQYAEPAYALDLLRSGAAGRGYLLKERVGSRAELTRAIETVAAGGSVIDPKIADLLVEARNRCTHSAVAGLTPRERELLGLIAQGKSNAAIAESLVLTKRAVEKHVNSIFAKLELGDAEQVSRRVTAALMYLAEDRG
jgi:DNA-binding NarL/FixJ family response regulator